MSASLRKHGHPPPPVQKQGQGARTHLIEQVQRHPGVWTLENQEKTQVPAKQQPGSRNLPLGAILCLAYFYLIEIGCKHAQG